MSESFSLIDDPWIPARFRDGHATDLSIREVFSEAQGIRELGGELPTQTFAITRLLLAILYRVADNNVTDELWEAWWRDGLPLGEIDAYLDRHAERFDLLHPERPFFQVADLATAKGEMKEVTPLILDLPSNNRLFTNRSGSGAARLSYAEAARWLVNAQAFDASGIKSGDPRDPRVKGGKGYPIGIAWSGHLGGLVCEGETLHETLLLNLVGGGKYVEQSPSDLPPWEEEEPDGAAERAQLHPSGPVRLFTWQSRRVRLLPRDGAIVGCLLTNGDALTPQNMQNHETMTAWRYSEPQTKKLGRPTYMPREHRPERAFWRGIGALIPASANASSTKGVAPSLVPATILWASALQSDGILDPRRRVRVRAIGVVYGSQSSVVDDVIDDRLTLSLAVLSEQHPALGAEAENAVHLADEGVWALRRLAENLSRAAGGDGEGDRVRAEESAYAALDGPYREWLAGLDQDTDPGTAISDWKATARSILRGLGADLVRAASPSAWRGRELPGRGGTELINTSRAESWFLHALHNTFGAPKLAGIEKETTV